MVSYKEWEQHSKRYFSILFNGFIYTVGSKIIRALEISPVKKFISNAVLWNKYCEVIIFGLDTIYNKHEKIKIESQTRENRKCYRKCSNNFAADCNIFTLTAKIFSVEANMPKINETTKKAKHLHNLFEKLTSFINNECGTWRMFILKKVVLKSLKRIEVDNLSCVQSAAKLFEHLRYFSSKNSYLRQFHEINICQVTIFRLYNVYNKY